MPFNLDNFKNQPPIVVIQDDDISGLFLFKKRLEQLFFSDIIIRKSDSLGKSHKMIIEVSCNFSLWEGMSNLKAGIWAQFRKSSNKAYAGSEFYKLITQLKEKNSFPIEVEEFSIIFQDCNIIINQIHEDSIPEQLDVILTRLARHYKNLTQGQEVPYEIFIPVFEEDTKSDNSSESFFPKVNTNKKPNYFDYWGLYFTSEDDAVIYDFKMQSIILAELNMLND